MIKIVISAHATSINWPKSCPCCGANADDYINLTFTKYKGIIKRRKQSVTKLEVPYCKACIDHVDATKDIVNTIRKIKDAEPPVMKHKMAVTVLVIALILTTILLTTVFYALMATKSVGSLMLIVIIGGTLFGIFGTAVIFNGASSIDKDLYQDAMAKHDAYIDDLERHLEMIKDQAPVFESCVSHKRIAVAYVDKYNQAHTLIFRCHSYAELFYAFNRPKIIHRHYL